MHGIGRVAKRFIDGKAVWSPCYTCTQSVTPSLRV